MNIPRFVSFFLKNVMFLEEGPGPEGAINAIPTKVFSDTMTLLCTSLGCPITLQCAVHGAEEPALNVALLQIPVPSGEMVRNSSTCVSELCSYLEAAMKGLQPFQKRNSSKRQL